MDIYINDQPLNFTLQGEKFFSEVRREVIRWLSQESYVVEKIDIDNVTIAEEEIDDWDKKDLGSVETIRFHVKPLAEVSFERIQTVYQYLLLLKKGLEKENTGLFKELSREYPIIEKELNRILNPKGADFQNSDVMLLTNLLEQSGFFKAEIILKDSAVNAVKICEGFIAILQERMHEITNPKGELAIVVTTLASLIEPLNDVPVQLQTGKDREAMHVVIKFVEASSKLLRLFPVLKVTTDFNMQEKLSSGETLEQFYSDFNAILYELTGAFDTKDSVLIGDLLEYEIAPRLENLITHMQQ